MKFEPLGLSHRALLEKPLKESGVTLSEYSFSCLYLFRSVHAYEVCIEGPLCIKGLTYDGMSYYMPISPASFIQLQDAPGLLYPIPEEWLGMVSGRKATYNDADSDYIYDTLQLSQYRGLAKKRNLVHQFEKQYEAECFDLTKERFQDALQVLSIRQDDEGDLAACKEAIELLETLKLDGKIYYVENKPVALIIGEPLGQDTYVIHFAKADIAYKGIYQYLYQTFCRTLENRYSFINMEQDLGREELRHAKHSYHPLRQARKFRLSK